MQQGKFLDADAAAFISSLRKVPVKKTLENREKVRERQRRLRRERKKQAKERERILMEKRIEENKRVNPRIFAYLSSGAFKSMYEEVYGELPPDYLYESTNQWYMREEIDRIKKLWTYKKQKEEEEQYRISALCEALGTGNLPEGMTKRRVLMLFAKPKWANTNKIREIYAERDRLNKDLSDPETYHVDHIVPICSDEVCGLHCEDNLRVVPASQNQSKGNRYWDVQAVA